ncbi:uncharacterized protein ACOB8E_002096 [Sarcophilus harrisii]
MSRNNYINMCFQITPHQIGNLNNRVPVSQEAYYGFSMNNFQLTRAEQDCFQEQVRNTLQNNFFYSHPQSQNNVFYPHPRPQNNFFYPHPWTQNNYIYPHPRPQYNYIYPHPRPQYNYFNLNSPAECFRKVNYGFVNLPYTAQSNNNGSLQVFSASKGILSKEKSVKGDIPVNFTRTKEAMGYLQTFSSLP